MQKRVSNQYKETQIKTANQARLIVMLYEGAIRFLNTALEHLPQKKYDLVNSNIIRAQDIITELMLSINFEGGEFANKLYSLYVYMNRKLVEGNVQKNEAPIKEVLGYLDELRDAWQQAEKTYASKDKEKAAINNQRPNINIST